MCLPAAGAGGLLAIGVGNIGSPRPISHDYLPGWRGGLFGSQCAISLAFVTGGAHGDSMMWIVYLAPVAAAATAIVYILYQIP